MIVSTPLQKTVSGLYANRRTVSKKLFAEIRASRMVSFLFLILSGGSVNDVFAHTPSYIPDNQELPTKTPTDFRLVEIFSSPGQTIFSFQLAIVQLNNILIK
jgi:hypothetical protein